MPRARYYLLAKRSRSNGSHQKRLAAVNTTQNMHLMPIILGKNTQDFSSLSRIGMEQQIASCIWTAAEIFIELGSFRRWPAK
jgi:hypothetical protein